MLSAISCQRTKPPLAQEGLDWPVVGLHGDRQVHLGFEAYAHGEDLLRKLGQKGIVEAATVADAVALVVEGEAWHEKQLHGRKEMLGQGWFQEAPVALLQGLRAPGQPRRISGGHAREEPEPVRVGRDGRPQVDL